MEHFKHSSMLMDGALPPTKLMKIKCDLCGYEGKPHKSKSGLILAIITNTTPYICPRCGKRDKLKKILNNFDEVSIKQFVNWRANAKVILVVSIVLGLNGIHYYFGEYKTQQTLINTNMAEELLENGVGADAAQLYIKSANEALIDADKMILLTNAAYSYLDEGMIQQAIVEFEKATQYSKKDSAEYELLAGEIAAANGQFEEALNHFNVAYGRKPQDFLINNALGLIYLGLEDGTEIYADHDKALKHFQVAYDSGERHMDMQEHLALAYFMLEDYDKALELFIGADTNKSPALHVWIGMTYLGKGDTENAKVYLQKAEEAGFITQEEIEELLIPADQH